MAPSPAPRADYGNWVAMRLVAVPALAGLATIASSFLWPWSWVLAAVLLSCAAYFVYARYCFSPRGKDVQAKIVGRLLDHVGPESAGTALDIGCGNGAVAIRLALRCPRLTVHGVDTWGRGWEFGKSDCERNAEAEGVARRTVFRPASAASLPYEDGAFDLVVSNLAFHEVRDAGERARALNEALRVLSKGGRFVLQDLFLWKRAYGPTAELLEWFRSAGVERVAIVETAHEPFIPKLLKPPFMVGTIAVIHGTK